MYKPEKKKQLCTGGCGSQAYEIENGVPKCFGLWMTWGCHYTKNMTEYDRKHYYPDVHKYRQNYQAMPLDYKERKKMIKYIEELEEQLWMPISRTPHEELLRWHDEKLKTEIRMLEQVRGSNGS